MDRREFLARSLMTGAAMQVLPTVAEASVASAAPASAPFVPFGNALFQSLIGQRFGVEDAGGARSTAVLTSIRPGPSDPNLEQFSLVFRPDRERATEGRFTLRHPDTGPMELHLDATQDATEHVAVFNLLIEARRG